MGSKSLDKTPEYKKVLYLKQSIVKDTEKFYLSILLFQF